MFLKPQFLIGATLVLSVSWLGLELFYFSPIKLEIQKSIQERIEMSDIIASEKINEKEFPHVSAFLQANLLSGASKLIKERSPLTTDYFTQAFFFPDLNMKSVTLDSSKLVMDKKILFYSVVFEKSSLSNIESVLNLISKSPKIINLQQLDIRFAGYGQNGARYHFNLKCSLPFFLEKNIHEIASL